jgi:hypothetical protein
MFANANARQGRLLLSYSQFLFFKKREAKTVDFQKNMDFISEKKACFRLFLIDFLPVCQYFNFYYDFKCLLTCFYAVQIIEIYFLTEMAEKFFLSKLLTV